MIRGENEITSFSKSSESTDLNRKNGTLYFQKFRSYTTLFKTLHYANETESSKKELQSLSV